MVFLMVLLFGGASFGQTTVTFVAGTDVSNTKTLTKSGVTISVGDGSLSGKTYYSCYKSKNLKISCSENKILKVELTSTVSGTGKYGPGCFKADNYTYDDKQGTWEGKANSVSLLASTNGVRMTEIVVTLAAESKVKTILSFGTDYDNKIVNVNIFDSLASPVATLTSAGSAISGNITYSSSDEKVATVIESTGAINLVGEGSAIITAKYAGDDTYAASSASYTINVVDGRTETSLTFPKTSYSFEQGADKGTETIEDNAAILSPTVDGAAIKYTSTGTDGLVEVLEDGSVIVNTNVIGSATITATFAGNDTYKPATASYTIQVYKPVSSIILNSTSKSFADIEGGGSGYKNKKCAFVSAEGDKYQFSVEDGMIQNDNLQLKATSGKVTSPTFGMENGYFVTVKYTSSTDMSLIIDGVKTIGKNGVVAAKATSDIPFVLQTGNRYSTVSEISISTKYKSLTTAASGFATYAADFAVDYKSAGLEAYAVKVNADNSGVEYTECTGVVPAGKAVLVKGTPSTEYTLTPATEDAGEFDTDLKTSDGNVTITADNHDKIYAFGTNNGKSGFKHVKVGATIAAKKGYLELNDATNAKDFFAFDNSITGIDNATIDIPEEEVPLFNLAGQRVAANYKGIVIKNGKKFVNK